MAEFGVEGIPWLASFCSGFTDNHDNQMQLRCFSILRSQKYSGAVNGDKQLESHNGHHRK